MKVLAGEWKEGITVFLAKTEFKFCVGFLDHETIPFSSIKSFDVVGADYHTSIADKVVAGAVGDLVLGSVGLLAGALGSGNIQSRILELEFIDGRKVLLKGDAKEVELLTTLRIRDTYNSRHSLHDNRNGFGKGNALRGVPGQTAFDANNDTEIDPQTPRDEDKFDRAIAQRVQHQKGNFNKRLPDASYVQTSEKKGWNDIEIPNSIIAGCFIAVLLAFLVVVGSNDPSVVASASLPTSETNQSNVTRPISSGTRVIKTKSMSFNQCLSEIGRVGRKLGIAPRNVVTTSILRMVRFSTNDGSGKSYLVTCSSLDQKLVINESW